MSRPDRMLGRRVGRYRIDGEIGRGGMGVVYQATQLSLNRTVAIKMLPPHLASSGEYLMRFRREAETLARLAHEDIVHIYDIEEDEEGSHYIIMEYVDGPSLTALLARERWFEPARARDIAVVLSNALAVAHRKGIVHRDIKPDNVLFTSAGRPKLTDFGIAHIRDDRKFKTHTGTMLGTPYYLAPEQALGKPVTPASDIYSLGIVLFEMLSGGPPFDGDDALAVALQHVQDVVPPLDDRTPEGLRAIVGRALEKSPANRFATAEEMQRALLSVDLGVVPGWSLSTPLPAPGEITRSTSCPECGAHLAADFLTCPMCGLPIRRRCTRCQNLYDPVAPACPACRTPAPARTPTPRPAEEVQGLVAADSVSVEAPEERALSAPAPVEPPAVEVPVEPEPAGAELRAPEPARAKHLAPEPAVSMPKVVPLDEEPTDARPEPLAGRTDENETRIVPVPAIQPVDQSADGGVSQGAVGVGALAGLSAAFGSARRRYLELAGSRASLGLWIGAALVATGLLLALLYGGPVGGGSEGGVDSAGAPPSSGGGAAPAGGGSMAGSPGQRVPRGVSIAGGTGETDDPSIELSRASLVFRAEPGGAAPSPQSVRIANAAGGELAWVASSEMPWIVLDPASGTAPAILQVAINPRGLDRGIHVGRVVVSAGRAGRSSIDVRLEIGSDEEVEEKAPVQAAPPRPTRRPPTNEPTEEKAPDQPPAGGAVGGGGAAAGSESDKGGFETNARRAIEGILSRYRRATESGRFDVMRADLSNDVARKWQAGFRQLHEDARNVSIALSGVTIEFDSDSAARANFRAVIRGIDRDSGESREYFAGQVTWRLARRGERWIVERSSI